MVCRHVLFCVCWVSIISQSSNSSNYSQSNDYFPMSFWCFWDFGGNGQFFHHRVWTPVHSTEKSCCWTQICSRWRIAGTLAANIFDMDLIDQTMMVGHPATSRLCLLLKHFIFPLAHQEVLILLRPVFNKGEALSPCFTFNDHFGGCFRRYSWTDVTCRNTDLPSTWPDAHEFWSDAWWKARHKDICGCKVLS